MIRSLIWIAVLIWIAANYGIWTAIGFFVFVVLILFLLAIGGASLKAWAEKPPKKEIIRRAKADYIEGAREFQQHYKAQLRNAQQQMREALERAEQCRREGYFEDAEAAIRCYEAWKPDAAELEKSIAAFEKQEHDAINNDGSLDLLGGWTPNKPRPPRAKWQRDSTRSPWIEPPEKGWWPLIIIISLITVAVIWSNARAEPNITILKVKPYQDRVLPPSEFEQSLKPILPPEEYDYPYKGKLIIGTVATLEDLQKECNLNFSWLLGCSFRRNDNTCQIIVVDEKFMHMRGWTRQQILRHEIGHCNGWPQAHPGMRPYDAKPGTAPVLDVDGIIYPVWKVWPR